MSAVGSNPRFVEIVGQAAELPPAQRAAFVKQACGSDDSLRSQVESLLLALDRAGDFLVSPTANPHGRNQDEPAPILSTMAPAEGPGATLGRYKLLQQIGEGGFGVVFMAEQEHPVRRRVALKVIKPGMDTRHVIARFEAERQALAMMDHPNIAKVFDAGATDAGRPYFVMELVRGTPLTTYCDKHQLSTRDRLELFMAVCQAIQHAHTKGIIHRDLKPSNVLVTVADGKPVPKVIDFGIAKATQARLTERTLFTQHKQLIGTPQYMSPEQAESDGVDIDTRSDVYSLGVLLYELLVGSTPLDSEKLRKMAYGEMQRVIREDEPPRPSTRVSALGEALTSVASHRKIEPSKLGALLRGELDWIVMKALEKDRARRYETAGGMAKDIERYLADETVEACPPSASYRLRKLVRRYRGPLRVGAAFALLLLIGTVLSISLAIRATRARTVAVAAEKVALEAKSTANTERDKALAETKRADETAQVLWQINTFFHQDVLRLASSRQLRRGPTTRRSDITVREALDNAADSIAGRFPGDPNVEAAIRSSVGLTYMDLGEYDRAQPHLEIAAKLLREERKEPDQDSLNALFDLARLYAYQGHDDKAEPLYHQAIDGLRNLVGEDAPDLVFIQSDLVMLNLRHGKFAEAEAMAEKLLARSRKVLGERHGDTLYVTWLMGRVYQDQRRFDQSEPLYRKLLQTDRATLPEHDSVRLGALEGLGLMYVVQEKYDQAEPMYRQAFEGRRDSEGEDSWTTHGVRISLAAVLVTQKKYAEAEPLLLAQVEWALAHADHVRDSRENNLQAEALLLGLYHNSGQPDKVLEWRRKLAPLQQQQKNDELAFQSGELELKGTSDVETGRLLNGRAHTHVQVAHFEAAAADFAKGIPLDPEDHLAAYRYGCLLAYLGRSRQYADHCKAILARFNESGDDPTVERTLKTCLLLKGDVGGDPKVLLGMVDQLMSRSNKDDWKWSWYCLSRGMALYRLGDWAACIESEESCKKVAADLPVRSAAAEFVIAMAHHRLGHPAEAKAALEKAERRFGGEIPEISSGYIGGPGVDNWLIAQTLRNEAKALLAEPVTPATSRPVAPAAGPSAN